MNRWSPNQIVAYRLHFARTYIRGWTQTETARRLEPYLGERWSKANFSAAERSVAGERVRQFSADDVVAFAEAFELPIDFFFRPPDESFEPPDRLREWTVDAVDEIAPPKASDALTPEQLDALARRPYADKRVKAALRAAEERDKAIERARFGATAPSWPEQEEKR